MALNKKLKHTNTMIIQERLWEEGKALYFSTSNSMLFFSEYEVLCFHFIVGPTNYVAGSGCSRSVCFLTLLSH